MFEHEHGQRAILEKVLVVVLGPDRHPLLLCVGRSTFVPAHDEHPRMGTDYPWRPEVAHACISTVLARTRTCRRDARRVRWQRWRRRSAGRAKGTTIRLDGVEVREYQGEKLGSVEDFRENSIKGPQQIDAAAYRLKVTGLVNKPGSYTYSEVTSGHAAYEKVVQLDCVEGWSVKVLWEGLLVSDLIKEAGAKSGANTVIFKAADGYSTSLPLAYLDDNDILLAYRMNGVTLPAERGFPFQLVAQDKWGYKWISGSRRSNSQATAHIAATGKAAGTRTQATGTELVRRLAHGSAVRPVVICRSPSTV